MDTSDQSETSTAVDPTENAREIREYLLKLPEKEMMQLLDEYATENKMDFSN